MKRHLIQHHSFLSKYANDSILLMNPDLQIIQANDRAVSSYGYTHDELLQLNLSDLESPDTPSVFKTMIKQIEEQKGTVYESIHHRKDGSAFPVEISSHVIEVEGKKFYQSIVRDITERKKTEKELEELSHRNQMILEAAGEGIVGLDLQGRITFANPAAAKKIGYTVEELIGQNLHDLLHHSRPDRTPYPWEECPSYGTLINGADRNIRDEVFWRKDGTSFPVRYTSTPIREQGKIVGAVVTYRDITERKRAEEALRESEKKYRTLFEDFRDAVFITSREGEILEFNQSALELFGYSMEEATGQNALRLYINPSDREKFKQEIEQKGSVKDYEMTFRKKDGTEIDCLVTSTIQVADDGSILGYRGVIRDITEHKQHERELEAIVTVATALRTASKRSEMFPIILDKVNELLKVEGAALSMVDSIRGGTVIELAKGSWTNWTGLRLQKGEGMSGKVIETGQPYKINDIRNHPYLTLSDLAGNIRAEACVPLIVQGKTIGALCIGCNTDISENKVRLLTAIGEIAAIAIYRTTLHEQTKQRAQRLSALHAIDIAITASLDLGGTFNILLSHVTAQLGVDAASVLLLRPHTQMLEYAAGRGFRSHTIEQTQLHLGEGHAGRAAFKRRIISVPNIQESRDYCVRDQMVLDEGFVTHYAVPLIAKGQVKGVLEIWHRSAFTPDQEWLSFMEALAAQAAIAIDNAELFESLQHSNIELTQAYNATIEGWSRALDIRDKETEGHTQRVTDMTLQLARAMGVSDAKLVHVRRGALLHDIGKMAISDSILLKPGPLTEEEMEIMRLHPGFAKKLLWPISFLQPAMDIPYYHHEKWDGTGYPIGLQGEQIPLAARIFAVVDVWDALLSDRPYRTAWPKEKVLNYIHEQSGAHFDPKVAEAFLRIISEKGIHPTEGL